MVVVLQSAEDSGAIDFASLMRVLWRARLLIVACVLVFGAVAVTHVLLAKRYYRAEAFVVAAENDGAGGLAGLSGQLGALGSLVGLSPAALGSRRDEYVALITSKVLLTRFIEQNNLMPILFADDWDAATGRWTETDPDKIPQIGDGIDKMAKKVLKVQSSKTGLIRVSAEWSDPKLAAQWVNGLVTEVNQHVRTQTIEDADRGMSFLEKELAKANTIVVREGIYRLQEANLNKAMLASVRDDFALRIVDPAVPPHRHFKPRVILELAMALFLGGAFAVGVAAWRRRDEWWIQGTPR